VSNDEFNWAHTVKCKTAKQSSNTCECLTLSAFKIPVTRVTFKLSKGVTILLLIYTQ